MNLLRAFFRDERGATAVAFAVALVPMLATFSLALDYASVNQTRSSYQSVADSAALAGATASTTDTDEIRKTRAKNWFDAMASSQRLPASDVTVSVKDGQVEVTASVTVKPMINMISLGDYPISVRSVAMISQEVIHRVLDVAMCIDATGSMQNTINSVKARAQSFSTDLNNALKARGLEAFDHMRIRVVYYRDFAVDKGPVYYHGWGWYGGKAMSTSDFFVQPAKKSDLEAFIGSESASGGGDEPESSYECINEGMSSKWFTKGNAIPDTAFKADEVYPVIILWSDANALPIPHYNSINSGQYPANMPQSETAFRNKWNTSSVIDQKNRLLVHFGLCNANSWSFARSLDGYMCGGTLSDGNTNMINKIADVMMVRFQNRLTRLAK